MAHFTGLAGVRQKKIAGVLVNRTISAFMTAIKKHRVASAAGDMGAITLWRDDRGQLRGAFCRYLSVLSEEQFTSQAAARRWLSSWLPECEHQTT